MVEINRMIKECLQEQFGNFDLTADDIVAECAGVNNQILIRNYE